MTGDVLRRNLIVAVVLMTVGLSGMTASSAALSGKVDIFSWWTAGGEANALKAIFDVYHKHNRR